MKPPASFGSAFTRFANSSTDLSMFIRKPLSVSATTLSPVGMQVEYTPRRSPADFVTDFIPAL